MQEYIISYLKLLFQHSLEGPTKIMVYLEQVRLSRSRDWNREARRRGGGKTLTGISVSLLGKVHICHRANAVVL